MFNISDLTLDEMLFNDDVNWENVTCNDNIRLNYQITTARLA